MPRPTFDKSNGWWYILVRDRDRVRVKIPLGKDPRWKGAGHKLARPLDDIAAIGRKYADAALQARHGADIPGLRSKPLADLLAEYLTAYRVAGKAPRSVRHAERAAALFGAYCASREIVDCRGVTPAVCRDYMEDCARRGNKRRTIAQRKALLSPAFDRARADGFLAINPWKGLAVPGEPGMKEAPHWSDAEVAAIEAELTDWARDLFLVGVHSGFRIEGLLNLRWRDVHWKAPQSPLGSLHCSVAKGGKPYRIPLFPRLREILARRRAEATHNQPDDLVFPSPVDPRKPLQESTAARRIRRAMKRAGIADLRRPCHTMRETFGTRCAARGVHPRTLMQWMNHTSLKQTSKYLHYDRDIEASEAAKLGDGPG